MKKTLLAIIFLLSCLSLCIAEELKISGTVTEDNGTAVPYASCVAYTAADSTFVAGTVTDLKGNFELTCANDSVVLTISYIGFDTKRIDISKYVKDSGDSPNVADLGTITLLAKNTELAEVVVKATKPQVRMENGNLVYNVEDLLKNNSYTSAHALLLDIPLLYTADGKKIELSGAPQGSVIYINGRKSKMDSSQLISYLQSLPAGNILEVEIVYLPSAEWQTSSSVINVKLKKITNYFTSGKISGEYERKSDNNYTIYATGIASVPKWSTYVSYSYNDTKSHYSKSQYGIHTVEGEPHDYRIDTDTRTKNHTNNLYGSITYTPNDNNTFDLVYSGAFKPSGSSRSFETSDIFENDDTFYKSSSRFNSVYLSYAYQQKVSSNFYWSNNYNDRANGYGAENSDFSEWNKNHTVQKTNSLNSNVNILLPLGKGWKFETGVTALLNFSYTSQHLENSGIDEGGIFDFTDAKQNEVALSGYMGCMKSFLNNRISIYPEVQASYFKTTSYTNFNIYPYFSTSINASKDHFLQLVFRAMRNQPTLSSMLNTISFENPYQISAGNPDLRPSNTWIEQLVYVFKNKYVLTFTAIEYSNKIEYIPYQLPDYMLQLVKPMNFGKQGNYSLAFTIPLAVGFYKCNLKLTGAYDTQYAADWHGMEINRKRFSGWVNMRNIFSILKAPRLTGYLNFSYCTPSDGPGYKTYQHYWGLNAGMSVSLLHDKLDMSLFVYDIFNTNFSKNSYYHHGLQNINNHTNFVNRNIDFTISYTIKDYREPNKKNLQDSRIGL